MESNPNLERDLMFQKAVPELMQINPRKARFPCCIVWCPLPVLSWLVPFVGHIGICREDGVILDFAGPNFVCVDNFAFGSPARYIQIPKDKCCPTLCLDAHDNEVRNEQNDPEDAIMTWDDALRKGTQEFQHRSYNLLTCNCHSFVANNLNRLGYGGGTGRWNVVNLAALIFLKGRWVNKAAMARSFLPFVVVFGLGLIFGGWTFLIGLAIFTVVLVGWFILGTYCFKNLIQL
ncbi:Reversion-to-ethylene sensitivity1 [Thalictrum thalictroides]|uniref:Reversion-to-ethylene sensitivity1 n=1 Tax=Thalictrum thalictroides TaxID=46969 RepID=A0A7J6W5Z7_THATH|nr:Reversion-to-ethylene sensitivity1 [Thalictrum thalictroides]